MTLDTALVSAIAAVSVLGILGIVVRLASAADDRYLTRREWAAHAQALEKRMDAIDERLDEIRDLIRDGQ